MKYRATTMALFEVVRNRETGEVPVGGNTT